MANLRAPSRSSTPVSNPPAVAAAPLDQSSSSALHQLISSGAVRVNFATGQLEVADGAALTTLAVPPPAPKKSPMTAARDIRPEDYTQSFLDFINENPTVFHAVEYFSKRLDKEGFTKLSERERWEGSLEKGGKYYLTRNGSSLVAFTIPESYEVGNGVGKSHSWDPK